ncbi:MAG: NB-ARC domain-containing protein [Gaiellaceae bacterium]
MLYRSTLPVQPSPLVGRERELEEAGALLRESRLLTLTGPGGSGKTRLALQLAAEAADDFPDGIYWVPLQSVRDAAHVMSAIAEALGAGDAIAEFVGDKRLLLVVDNLEQVVEAAPQLAELLAQTPSARILATSREPLHIAGEHRFSVEPLPTAAGVELFSQRVRAVDRAFRPTLEVEEICRRLDGLPLAIELAAARVGLLAPDALLARLEQTLPVLTGGRRDAPERHRTLAATIQWSYELLSPAEQDAFRKLAVCPGSFSTGSAETVCEASLDTIGSLVEKSLVRRWESGRLGMLETIREFAAGELGSSSEREGLRRRHAEHFLALAAPIELAEHALENEALDFARTERDNLRAALEWSVETRNFEFGLRLATALESYWSVVPHDGMRWFEELLAGAPDAPLELRARALRAYGGAANPGGDDALAERLYQASRGAFLAVGDEGAAVHLVMRLGHSALYRGDTERARELAESSLAGARAHGDLMTESQALGLLGELEYGDAEHETGLQLLERSAALAGEIGFTWWRTAMLGKLVDRKLELGMLDAAAGHAREALTLASTQDDRQRILRGLARLARIEAERGNTHRAGRLWGVIEAEEERGPLGAWGVERERFAGPVLAHSGLEFERGREVGRALPLDDAVAEALAEQG